MHEGISLLARERLLPLEHSDLNGIESSVAQKKIRQEIQDLLEAINTEVTARIEEEKAQAAKARSLTDALSRGLKIVNRHEKSIFVCRLRFARTVSALCPVAPRAFRRGEVS